MENLLIKWRYYWFARHPGGIANATAIGVADS